MNPQKKKLNAVAAEEGGGKVTGPPVFVGKSDFTTAG